MRLKTGLQLAAAGFGCLLGLTPATLSVSQLSQNLPEQTQAPAPAPAAAGAPEVPAKPAELSLEQRADVFMARKAYADAVEYYRRALKQPGSSPATLWNKIGIAYQQQTNFRAARKAYNEAIRRRKDFAEAWNNLGTTYYLQNKFRKSLKFYARAIELNPNSATFHLNLGTSCYRLKKYDKTMEEYRSALTLDPNCMTSRSSVGTVLQARGADAEYYFYMAKVHASLGRAEGAVRYLRHAFEDGFKDLKRLDEDPDFQKIGEYPPYLELRKSPPVPIQD